MVTTRSKASKMVTSTTERIIASDPEEPEYNNNKTKLSTRSNKSTQKSDGTRFSQSVIFISLLIDLIAFTVILPLFPKILQHYKENDGPDGLYLYLENQIDNFQQMIGIESGIQKEVLFGGSLGSLFSFLQFLTSPIIGALSDVYGRKPVVLMCLIGICISYWLWSTSLTFLSFVIARMIGGACKGNLSLSMAAMTDVSTAEKRASGMALIGAAFSIGFVVGPLIGAYFASTNVFPEFNVQWFAKPAYFAMFLSLVDILFVLVAFKETLPKEKRLKSIASSLQQAILYINIRDLFYFNAVRNVSVKDLRDLRLLGVVYFLYLFLYSGLEFTITFLADSKFGFSRMELGYMLCCSGIVMAILQGSVVRRIPPNAVQKYVSWGLLIIVPSFICIGIANSRYLLNTGIFIYAISTSFVVPCMTTIASKYGNVSQKGTVLGIFRSLGYLARAIGPMIASTAYWIMGPMITYCVGGILLLVPWYLIKFSKSLKI